MTNNASQSDRELWERRIAEDVRKAAADRKKDKPATEPEPMPSKPAVPSPSQPTPD